jgi:hypothetical protein
LKLNRRSIADTVVPILDLLLGLLVVLAALILWFVRRLGLQRLRFSRAILNRIGVLPVRRHYYEPYFDARDLRRPLDEARDLPGIDWNEAGQLELLSTLTFQEELAGLDKPASGGLDFRFGNGAFESGDAEFLYQMVRKLKPARLIEVGSGHSTLLAHAAILRNRNEAGGHDCRHICIEPFENPWLDKAGVTVLRQRVEEVDLSLFDELGCNDLLFIDSSHVIRPQGDVVTEYLGILPRLRPGVVVHVHDVFSPRDYPAEWVLDKALLWDEQYLLEAFLTCNSDWSIIGALNFLKHRHFEKLKRVCPYLTVDREPGSIYIRRD